MNKLKAYAKSIKGEIKALSIAYQDPRTPWYAKAFVIFVISSAISPIDLIPDFIPILGYIDDLILIPIGITIAIKMIPADVMEEARQKAKTHTIKNGKTIYMLFVFLFCLFIAIILINIFMDNKILTLNF